MLQVGEDKLLMLLFVLQAEFQQRREFRVVVGLRNERDKMVLHVPAV